MPVFSIWHCLKFSVSVSPSSVFLRPCMLYLFPPGSFFLHFYFISCVYFITFFLSFSNFEIHSSVFYVVSSFWSLLANFEIIVYCLRLFVMGEVLYFVACFHGLSRCYSALFFSFFFFLITWCGICSQYCSVFHFYVKNSFLLTFKRQSWKWPF